MRIELQTRVSRPLDEVFVYVADFSNIEKWDPGVVRSTKVGDLSVGVGTRFDVVVRFGPSTIPMTYVVTAFEPPHRVLLVGKAKSFEGSDDIRFAVEGAQTVISYTADLNLHNAFRYVAPLLEPVMRRMGERALDRLATVLDG